MWLYNVYEFHRAKLSNATVIFLEHDGNGKNSCSILCWFCTYVGYKAEGQDPGEAFNLHIETCTKMVIAALFPTVKN